MNKAELEKLAEKYRKKAETAYRNYQETGITRYSTQQRNTEELADALQMAVDAKEEHDKLYILRATVYDWAQKADRVVHGDSTVDVNALLEDILRQAERLNVYTSRHADGRTLKGQDDGKNV